MLSSQIKSTLHTVPFQAFSIVTADGRKIPVVGRDFMTFSRTGRSAIVHHKDESFDILDTLLITGMNVEKPATTSLVASE